MAWPSSSARTKTWGTEILTSGDLDGQFDILHQYNNDQLNGTSGHTHSGGTSEGPQLPLTSAVTGILPIANGGTGLSTLAAILNLIYPVGSIYVNGSVSTNPATLLGVGTWSAISGFIAGLDGTTEFDTIGQTGGAKTATISTNNLPASPLTVSGSTSNGSSNNTIQFTTNGGSITTKNTSNLGSGTAMPILPPYTVMYVWQRTA